MQVFPDLHFFCCRSGAFFRSHWLLIRATSFLHFGNQLYRNGDYAPNEGVLARGFAFTVGFGSVKRLFGGSA